MNKWINIEEKKPEIEKGDFNKVYSVNVLVTDGQRVTIGYYIYDHDLFEVCECVNKDLEEVATHWMPLPKPPKD